jgi:thiamine kinase-like enzyme
MTTDTPRGATVRQALARHFGGRRRVSSVICLPSPNRSSFVVNDLDVRLDDGTTLELVAKAAHWDALSAEARRAKPRFLWDPERERASYEAILSPRLIGSARYFGSCGRSGARYLLLERINGTPLWQHGDRDAWREAARWLARMHVEIGLERAAGSRAASHLIKYDRQFYDRWIARADSFHRRQSRQVRTLMGRYRRVIETLLTEPVTFIHGEFYAANVLIEARRAPSRGFVVRPVDWEMAALAPPSMDLACLVAGRWTDEERADIADAYYQERARHGDGQVPRAEALKTLDYCLIHLCVRNLGWARDWAPPPDRAYDWLADALRLCDKWQL